MIRWFAFCAVAPWDTVSEPTSRIAFRWYFSVQNDKPRNDFGFRVVLQPSSAK